MAKKTLNIGTTANDGQGDTLREAASKINENFTELFSAAFGGTGAGYLTPEDINTLVELNVIVGDATLVDSATIQARIDAAGGGGGTGDLNEADIDTILKLNNILVGNEKLVDSAEINARIAAAAASGAGFSNLSGLNTILTDATLVDSDQIVTMVEDGVVAGVANKVDTNDSRLTDNRDPNQHANEAHSENFLDSDTVLPLISSGVANKVDTNDSRLNDNRDPNLHANEAHSKNFLDSDNLNTLAKLNDILDDATLVDSATIQANIATIQASIDAATFTDLAGLNSILTDAELIDSSDSRLLPELPEFFGEIVGDKVLIVQTGQSNPQGGEVRRVGSDNWDNENVYDWQWSVRNGATDSIDLTDPAHANWGWVNPTASQAVPTNQSALALYMGYIGGNTGNQVYALANEVQLSTGLDVYVVNLCQGGQSIEWYEYPGVTDPNTGVTYDVADILKDHVQHILDDQTPINFGGKPGPDITTWGQSEANFYEPLGSATTAMTPAVWAGKLDAVFNVAKGQTKSWISEGYTKVFLTEATDYVNWNGTAGTGSYAGVPYRWNGANIASTEYGDDVTLVSSRGIEHGDGVDTDMESVWPVGISGAPTNYVHFSGDGNDEYGRRIADVILGREREFKDTDLDVLHGSLETRLGNFIQSLYGTTGRTVKSFTHFSNLDIGGVYNTSGGLIGSEPVRLYSAAGGSVEEVYNAVQPGHVKMKTVGLNIAGNAGFNAGYTGIEMTELYPLFPIEWNNSLGNWGGINKVTFGAVASYVTNNNNTDTPLNKYVFRLGQFFVMSAMAASVPEYQETGIYFEFRWDSPNWWICVKDTFAPEAAPARTSGRNVEIDTGIPVTQYGVSPTTGPFELFSPAGESLKFVHDLVAEEVTFSINGTVPTGGVISTTAFDGLNPQDTSGMISNLNSLGAYVLKYAGNTSAAVEVDLDLMFGEVEHGRDNMNVEHFI